MHISFHGAVDTVTGSRHLVETGGTRLLLDCGMFQGYKVLRERNWAPPPPALREADAVVLSHAHLDHSGWLPALVWSIFSKIWLASSVRKVPLPTRRLIRPWRSIICNAARTAVRLALS